MIDQRCLINKEKITEGLEFENNEELEEAYRCYLEAAESGNPLAMFMIGNLYFYKSFRGKEIPVLKMVFLPWEKQTQIVPDLEAAYSWFLRSAQEGFPDAMSNVGTMLYYGQGVEKNHEASKEWLIKASRSGSQYGKKALKDFFGIDLSETVSDEEYDEMLERFCEAVERHEPSAGELYQRLILGSDPQLCRLGYRIAVGQYHIDDAYRDFAFPKKSNGRSCAPVSRIRVGWTTLLIVNRNAFPEKEPIISYSVDGYSGHPEPVRNALLDTKITYRSEKEWGWHPITNNAQCLKLTDCDKPGERIESVLCFAETTLETLEEKLSPRDDEALFFDPCEKEYSVEICHIHNGKAISLLRYTVGGYHQGDIITGIPLYQTADDSQ